MEGRLELIALTLSAAMGWRDVVNKGLAGTTGYRLEKARKPEPKRRKPPPFPRFYDEEARAVIRAVRPWTMTSNEKLFALVVAVRYVVDHEIPGDVVECGVWRGGSMQAIARVLAARGATDRELHLFDTFEGMPPPTEQDVRHGGPPAAELLATRPRTAKVWAVADLEDVRAGMAQVGYPAERVHYHPGLVEDTIPAQAPERIALLRLDTDWYASTRHELEHLYDRVPAGGVVIIDDYDYWEGSRKAVDEFVADTGARLMLAPMGSGRIAIKP
jgi:O-methyltransferase